MATYKDVLMLVDKVTEPLKRINKQTQQTNEKIQNMKKQVKDVGGKFAAFAKKATVALTIVASALTFGLKKVSDYGDRIDKMSQKIGMSRKAFQEWDYIMSQNGGSVESLQMGFKTLTTQIEGVQKGSKDSIKAFSSLGVSVKDANGQLRSQDDIFNDTIRKLQQIKNPTQKAMLANRLFGRSAAELRPLLNQEAEAVDELREKANRLGLIVSDKDIKNAVILKDTFDTFGRAFQAKFASSMMKLMPLFTKLLDKIMPVMEELTIYFEDLSKTIANSPAFIMMSEQFKELGAELTQFYLENKDFFDALQIAFEWLMTTGLPNLITSTIMVIKVFLKVVTSVKNFFAWIGGAIGNLVGWIISIPTRIQTAFIEAQNIILRIFVALKRSIGDAIGYIIERLAKMLQTIGAIAGKIPGLKGLGNAITDIGNGITSNFVRQTQNNNTVNNSTTNNYYGGQSTMQNKPKFNTAYVAP